MQLWITAECIQGLQATHVQSEKFNDRWDGFRITATPQQA
jgi:hypothetical protein